MRRRLFALGSWILARDRRLPVMWFGRSFVPLGPRHSVWLSLLRRNWDQLGFHFTSFITRGSAESLEDSDDHRVTRVAYMRCTSTRATP